MKLKTFQIRNYKVVDDTGPVGADPSVTALVGKNESGKTAIMKAMWKCCNVANVKFEKLYDYPRDRYMKDRKGNQEVCVLKFEMSSEQADKLVSQLPKLPSKKPKFVTLRTYYAGEDNVSADFEFDPPIGLVGLTKDARDAVEAVAGVIAIQASDAAVPVETARATAVGNLNDAAPLWEPRTLAALDGFQASVSAWIQANIARQGVAQEERRALDDLIARAKGGDPEDAAKAWAENNIPTFIYFDQYGQLETRINLPQYLGRKNDPDAKTRTQAALFDWSHIDPQEILELGQPRQANESSEDVDRRLDKRRALLDSASFSLTGDWTKWWTERRHKLHFSADGDNLVLTVSDEHSEFPIPFEERSRGLQWFFSFYLVFQVESRKVHKDAILLLDEPGLHLHPTLQSKLINFFERVSKENQLLYSTHLPFLVDPNHLKRVRTVHLAGKEPRKAVVSTGARPTGDRDTLFPLQAALGYAIAQTLIMGKRTLVLEGITGYAIIEALDACLTALKDKDTLHKDTVRLPAGGTARLMPLASIMMASAAPADGRMLVLVDSDNEGKKAAKQLKDTFGNEAPVVPLESALGMAEATIEDLIPRDDYANAVKKVSSRTFTLSPKEKLAPTNVKAIEWLYARKKWGDFAKADRTATALFLVREWSQDASQVPKATLDHARKLFRAINNHFKKTLPN